MSFDILKQLQYCTCSDYGNNLNKSPSRIIPFHLADDSDESDCKFISPYVPHRLGNEMIICDSSIKLPAPCAYFKGSNTFIKSFLYLTNNDYYKNVHLPLKVSLIMETYIKNLINTYTEKEKKKNNKFIQYLLNNKIKDINFEPNKNKYFNKLLNLLLKYNKCEIVVIKENSNGCFKDIIPKNFNKSKKKNKKYYILLQHLNGLYSPYGSYLQ